MSFWMTLGRTVCTRQVPPNNEELLPEVRVIRSMRRHSNARPTRCLNCGSERRATARKRSYSQRQKGSSGNQQQNPRYAFFWGVKTEGLNKGRGGIWQTCTHLVPGRLS